jgi:hypothetical protein
MKTQSSTLRILAALGLPLTMATATVALAAFLAVSPLHQHRRGPGVVTILNDVQPSAKRLPRHGIVTILNDGSANATTLTSSASRG